MVIGTASTFAAEAREDSLSAAESISSTISPDGENSSPAFACWKVPRSSADTGLTGLAGMRASRSIFTVESLPFLFLLGDFGSAVSRNSEVTNVRREFMRSGSTFPTFVSSWAETDETVFTISFSEKFVSLDFSFRSSATAWLAAAVWLLCSGRPSR